MNVKDRIEKDSIFDMSERNAIGIIKSLNNHNIYTIEELINSEDMNLPFARKKQPNGKQFFYQALRSIFKYKYLGEDFELEKILTKSYPIEPKKPNNKFIFNIDARKLGLVIVSTEDELFDKDSFTMDEVLKRDDLVQDPSGVKLKEFYLKYLEELNKDNPNYTNMETIRYINYLKEELPSKIKRKEVLNEYITDIKSKIERLERVDESSDMYETARNCVERFNKAIEPVIEELKQLENDIAISEKRINDLSKPSEDISSEDTPSGLGTK